MDIKGKKALITGATEFVGGRLAERPVREEGVQVRALVRDPSKANRLSGFPIEIVHGDITKPDTLTAALEGCRIVFHSAALVSEKGTRDEFWQLNVEGTRNVLEAACHVGVERFVHLSSVAVYGLVPADGTSESVALTPCQNASCDTKIEAERIAFDYSSSHRLPLVVIRPVNV